MNLENVEVKGNKLTITREELALQLEACIRVQTQARAEADFDLLYMALGHAEAIKDMIDCFD